MLFASFPVDRTLLYEFFGINTYSTSTDNIVAINECSGSLELTFVVVNSTCRGLGPWGPDLVRKYTSARFGAQAQGTVLTEEESRLLTGTLPSILFGCGTLRSF